MTGTPTGWAKTWGPMGDGRSKLRRRSHVIEAALRAEYAADTALDGRRVRQAAHFMALAESVLDQVGTDPKATPRRAAILERAALGQLSGLTRRADLARTGTTVRVQRFGKGA